MSIENILIEASMLALEASDLNKEQLASAKATVTQVGDVMVEYREALGHIAVNKRLSAAGREHDTADLKTSTDNRLAQITNPRLESLDARVSELEFQTRPQQPDGNPILEEMRQQEARTQIAGHAEYSDQLQLIALYQALAIDGTNDLLMRSIENSPLPLITDLTILEDGKRARGERTNRDAARILKQLKAVRAAIKDAADTARAELNLPNDALITLAAQGAA